MRIKLRGKIYTTIPAIENKSCKGCAFLSWQEGMCTALIPIHRACLEPDKVLQYSNLHFDIFNL